MYNPSLEKLRNQAEQRLYQKRMEQLAQYREQTSMRSLFDPLFNVKAREKVGGSSWFETTALGYKELIDYVYGSWAKNPGQALINDLTFIGDTLDYAANLIKAPIIALAKGEDVGERLSDAYGLGDEGRVTQNMSEFREAIGAIPSGIAGGTLAGAMIGTNIAPGWGTLIGAGVGLVVGTVAGITGHYNITIGNTVTDMALEMAVDPANIAGAVAAVKAASTVSKVAGASADVAKAAAKGATNIDNLAKGIAKQSSKNYDDFVRGIKSNIDSQSFLDHALHKAAETAAASGADDVTKAFMKSKNKLMKSYIEGNFDDFQAALVEIGMYQSKAGEAVLDMAKTKQVFDIMVKDSGVSRGYKLLAMFDKFDSNLAKGLMKATPMGMGAMAFKKSMSAIKNSSAKKAIAEALNDITDDGVKVEPKIEADVFAKLDADGVIYKQTPDMTSKQSSELYESIKAKAKEYEEAGDTVTAAVLNKQANKIVFDDGMGHVASSASVKSDLNLIVRVWINNKGDLNKVLNDPAVVKAYTNITNLLYFSVGEYIILDYITRAGYNKSLYLAIKKLGNAETLAKYAGKTGNAGAHLIIADVLYNMAKQAIDEDPARQYIKTLNSIAEKTLKQKQGSVVAETQLKAATRNVQMAIMSKYNKLKNTGSVTSEIEIEYNKALVEAGRHRFNDGLKKFMEPRDYNKLYVAETINKNTNKVRALQNKNVEEFINFNKLLDNDIKNKIADIEATSTEAIKMQQISHTTEKAQSILMSIVKQKASGAIESLKHNKDITNAELEKFQKDIEHQVSNMLKEFKIDLDEIHISSLSNNTNTATAAKLYRILDFIKKQSEMDPEKFYDEILKVEYDKQLKFIKKYKKSTEQILNDLTFLTDTANKEIKKIDKYISSKYKSATKEKKKVILGALNYITSKGQIRDNVDDYLATLIDEAISSYHISDDFINMVSDLNNISNINFHTLAGVGASLNYIRQGFKTAMNKNKILYMYTMADINENILKNMQKTKSLEFLFKEYFENSAIAQPIIDSMLKFIDDYKKINDLLVYAGEMNRASNVKAITEMLNNANKSIVDNWRIYSSYIYLERHIKDLGVLTEDDNFTVALKGLIDNLNELNKLPVNKNSEALKHSLILGYVNEIENTIKTSLGVLFTKSKDGVLMPIYKEDFIIRMEDIITDPVKLNYFLNNMTTAVKSLRLLEYVTKFINIPDKTSKIKDAISIIGGFSERLMYLVNDSNMFTSNKEALMWYAYQFRNNLLYASSKLMDVIAVTEYVHDVVTSKHYDLMSNIKSDNVIKYIEQNSSNYVKGIDLDLTIHYKQDARFTKEFNFLEVDEKVVKLVTEDGVIDLPEDLDVTLDKFIKADIETTLIFNGKASSPEDVVQLAFTGTNGKQNIIILNPNYTTSGNKDLLSEDIVKGNVLNENVREGLMNGTIPKITVNIDGNDYTFYGSRELAFKAMYDNLKDNIVEHNGKRYIAVIGQNSTKFDDPVLLKGLNQYANAGLAGIVSEDTLPYINVFRGLAQVIELFDNRYRVSTQITDIENEILNITDLLNELEYEKTIILDILKNMNPDAAIKAHNTHLSDLYNTLKNLENEYAKLKKSEKLGASKFDHNQWVYITSRIKKLEDEKLPNVREQIQKVKTYGSKDVYTQHQLDLKNINDNIAKLKNQQINLKNRINQLKHAPNTNELFIKTLGALKDLGNAKLENVYEALRKAGLVADLTGRAHDASYDILMTEEVLNALHRALGEDFKSIKDVKNALHTYANAYNFDIKKRVNKSQLTLRRAVKLTLERINNDFDKQQFERAIENIFDLGFPNLSNAAKLVAIEDYLNNINNFLEFRKDDSTYAILRDVVTDLQNDINRIRVIRENALKGVYGDAIVQARPNAYWVMDTLSAQYHWIRNSETFLKLYDIFKGEDVDATDYSLVGLVKRFKQEFDSTESYQLFMDQLTDLYNYTERIDKFTQFNNQINSILNKRLASIDKTNIAERDKYLIAFSRVQDKLFGFGTKETNLSFDGWFRRMLYEQKHGYILDADGNRVASKVKFNQDVNQIKQELKEMLACNRKFSMADIEEDLKLLDADGAMEKLIIEYISDCIDNIEKYNIFSRDGNAATILKPVADAQYWNQFRNAYNSIIDGYKFNKTNPITGQTAGVNANVEYSKSIDVDVYDAELDLVAFMEDARQGLSYVNAEFNRCRQAGLIPEGWLNETYNKNTWEINGSHNATTFSHTGRAEEYYINTGIRDKFYENMGIKFDPKKQMDVITYKNEESAAIKSIQGIRDASGLYINEINELINEFNFNGMEYKLPKIKMYSDYYDEIVTALEKQGKIEEFKPYQEFAETMFKTTFGYLEESKQMDAVLRSQYEQMYKAIAISMYTSAVENKSVFDTLAYINREAPISDELMFTLAKKSMNESYEQIMNLFKRADSSYDYEAMYYYVSHHKDLQFALIKKSDKFFKQSKDKKLIAQHEIQTFDVNSPEQLQSLMQLQLDYTARNNSDFMFSILDRHSIADIKKRIGHVADNRVYKLGVLNVMVEMRKWISKHILAPLKTLSLMNLGFTFTNALEGGYKTFISTTGDRSALFRNYGNAMRMKRDWYNLTSEIAKATQGSMFWSTKDQLKLLEHEYAIGKSIFKNWDGVLKGETPILNNAQLAVYNMQNNKLPAYMISKFEKLIKENKLEINKYSDRFKRVAIVVEEELPKYNLDEYKATSLFINSPAAAAEFQSIKKSSELNVIGGDKNDTMAEQVMNKLLYSDKWMGEHNPLRLVSPYANLSRNSDIELINRYAMYLNMVESGYTKNEALNKVLATHFNYGDKSNLEMGLEMFFPFISFPLRNFIYWNDALQEHPALLKSFIDMTICNWGDEKDNPYNQTKITKGGIRLWNDVSIESGFSGFDAMAFGGNALNILTQRKLNPLVGVAIEGAKQLAVGESNLSYRWSRLPVISHVQSANQLVNSLIQGQPKLYDIAPSMFNEVYKTNRYYYNNQGRYAYKSAYNRLYYTSGQRRTGINQIKTMVTR